jgi:acyl-CoA hydrolase
MYMVYILMLRDNRRLESLIRPGASVALSDGAGLPTMILPALNDAAALAGGVSLLLGWSPGPLDDLDVGAFERVSTMMGGYGIRPLVDGGQVAYIPVRWGTAPALVLDVLRPDVLVASVVRSSDGYRFGSEVGWLRAAVTAGAIVAGIERFSVPGCDAGPPLPPEQVVIIGSSEAPPIDLPIPAARDEYRTIAHHVARLVPEGARIQFGAGAVGDAMCRALDVPVRVRSGLLSDGVVDLDRRGLLLAEPTGAYLAGTSVLYEWAAARPILHPLDVTHHPGRLADDGPFVALNTALELDIDGQVNVESAGGSAVAGVGGHPDFAFAAARSPGGLSIVALPSRQGGRSTLVERLESPVSTPGHDVDVVVTERGVADLRGLGRSERRSAIAALW